MTDRRFIEESFPVKEVGEISAREKSIRHGHISTLHIWWARRPLAASRATAYAALTPAPTSIEEWQKKRDFIIELSKWENSNNQQLLERARQDILDANGGVPPKVLDPFSGGGSYPLEALRLGCESYANDYNPVAVLLEKATLEYPQKFGRSFDGMPKWAYPKDESRKNEVLKEKKGKASQPDLFDQSSINNQKSFNPLLEAVRYWGAWVLEEARKELAEFYPPDLDGSIPVGYIWARTIPCQNPACGAVIPLMRSFWLSNSDKKKVALCPSIEDGKLSFRVVGNGYASIPSGFDPEKGTVARAVATCPVCGTVIDDDTTRRIFKDNRSGQQMIAVILSPSQGIGKKYRSARDFDEKVLPHVASRLQEKRDKFFSEWGIDPIPDEIITDTMPGGFHTPAYGMNTWGSLFNLRQALALVTFCQVVRRAYEKIPTDNIEFRQAIVTYLGLAVDRLADYNSMLCVWHNTKELVAHTFGRQALQMAWDYIEVNPFSDSTGNWAGAFEYLIRVLDHCGQVSNSTRSSSITQASATRLPFPDNYFDAILTDPPYYYSVTYADLSDFFYVWLKRSLGHIYPDLFLTPLTPKDSEIIEKSFWDKTSTHNKDWYEAMMKTALKEVNRVTKKTGIIVIVYAHKTTEGWEALINSILDSGFVVTGSWPIKTEMQARLMAKESAALASSIYIVARKMPRQPTGFYNDVRQELRKHLDAKLQRLWGEGIGGADFFIAAIGSAIEVFGKYEQVMDFEGNIVRANRLLDEVRTIATDYAVRQILHNGFATEISDLSRFYVLWRWNYGEALVPFDEARKLAQSCGIDVTQQWGKNGFIKKEKGFIRVLGPQNRKLDDLDDPRDLIDVLHKALLLWEQSKRPEMIQALAERGYGNSEAFYRVAQAISETLPMESKEKKLLDGFLAGRERVQQEVEKVAAQGRLWE